MTTPVCERLATHFYTVDGFEQSHHKASCGGPMIDDA